MSILEAILLGALQGLTEFLPVSSSGHLKLGQYLLEIREPQLLFDIVLHLGTLLAVVAFYWRDVREVVVGLYQGSTGLLRSKRWADFTEPQGARLALLAVVATVPTGIIGVFLDRIIDPSDGEPLVTAHVVAALLLVNGAVLFVNRFLGKGPTKDRSASLSLWNITVPVAIGIGIAQGFAVMPGFSRSGLTITCALALGILRVEAARFSFLISIPAILAALVFKFDASVFTGATTNELLSFGLGAIAAGAVGYVAILILVETLKKARFHHFSWYCWAVGLAALAFL
jgi:undecaprenyl-diphosphatase